MYRTDPTFSEELADGALEWAEALYSTVPPYRDGWSQIHPQDREDWLAGLRDLREPFAQLALWRGRGLLSRTQTDRHSALLALKAEYDPLIADLAVSLRVPRPGPAAQDDDFDLI